MFGNSVYWIRFDEEYSHKVNLLVCALWEIYVNMEITLCKPLQCRDSNILAPSVLRTSFTLRYCFKNMLSEYSYVYLTIWKSIYPFRCTNRNMSWKVLPIKLRVICCRMLLIVLNGLFLSISSNLWPKRLDMFYDSWTI